MRPWTLLGLLSLSACQNKGTPSQDTAPDGDGATDDGDGDGYSTDDGDCNDSDASSHPGALEICDGIDNNCDDVVDEGVTTTYYIDADSDGFGDPLHTTDACDQPSGTVSVPNDCDDTSAETFPGASERCDGFDNNCDGVVDEEVQTTWFADADRDGFGDAKAPLDSCDPPAGYVSRDDDCDDLNDSAFPDHPETCDEADNNCDGTVDEGVTTTFYQDVDGDSYGVADSTTESCDRPTGYAAEPGDCQDGDRTISPSATELCDSQDNDCDGDIDEDSAVDAATWYADSDSDGYGDAADTQVACSAPSGYVASNTDCDDTEEDANPGEAEVCDSIDNDCDRTVDEASAIDASTWYADSDGDGYGTSVTTVACSPPTGFAAQSGDCNDATADANPGEVEVCDSIDNDCDGSTDEGVTTTFYLDDDRDSYGDAARTTQACSTPSGYATNDDDCDDTDASARPGGAEVCDEADNDCDGSTDEGVTTTFYGDADLDGYGEAATPLQGCSAPSGYVDNDEDCDDDDTDSNPAASEDCDEADNDCDGDTDEGVLGRGSACPAESCAEIIDDQPSASDGSYYLDPTGSGAATLYTCEMSTDGGGWTLIADWDRASDGDSLSDFTSTYTALYNNMTRWTTGSGYIEWADYDATADALAYKAAVIVPNGGELLYDLYFYGYSMEQSGIWFFVEAGGSDQNLLCKENLDTSAYSSTELGYRPGYTCTSSSATSWTWSYTKQQTSFSSEITAFHMHSLMYDTYGDYASLYRLGFWVR